MGCGAGKTSAMRTVVREEAGSSRASSGLSGLCLIVLLGVNVLKGGSVLAIKLGLSGMPPVLSAGLRFTLAGFLLWLIVWRSAPRAESPGGSSARPIAPLWLLLPAAALAMALAYALFYVALDASLVSRSALFVNLNPFYVSVLAAVFLKERLSMRHVLGLAVAFGGVLVLEAGSLTRGEWARFGVADLLLVGSGLAWAFEAVLKKYLVRWVSPVRMTAWEVLPPGVMLLAWGTWREGWSTIRWDGQAVGSLAYLVLGGTVLAFAAFNWVLQRAPASKVVAFSFVIPVTAFSLGVLVRGEPIRWELVVALGLVAAGLWILGTWRRAGPALNGGLDEASNSS